MQNPFFRAKLLPSNEGVDINLNHVAFFRASTEQEGATTVMFTNGHQVMIDLSPAAVRGRTRKAWPENTALVEAAKEAEALNTES